MISYDKAKAFLDSLPVIMDFCPPYEEQIQIERYTEQTPYDPNFMSRMRLRFKGPGKYGIIGYEDLRDYFAYGFSDYFDNPCVKIIGKSLYPSFQELYYIYSDNKFLSWWYEVTIRIRSFVRTIERRILETLAIWDLADREIGRYPGWEDVKVVKWFRKRMKFIGGWIDSMKD